MKYIYVLSGSWNYEGSDILGAFTSKKKAEKFKDDFISARKTNYDEYFIEKIQVDKVKIV